MSVTVTKIEVFETIEATGTTETLELLVLMRIIKVVNIQEPILYKFYVFNTVLLFRENLC